MPGSCKPPLLPASPPAGFQQRAGTLLKSFGEKYKKTTCVCNHRGSLGRCMGTQESARALLGSTGGQEAARGVGTAQHWAVGAVQGASPGAEAEGQPAGGRAGGPSGGTAPGAAPLRGGFGGELGQGLQPREAPAAPLAPRPAVPLRREEEEEVGMVLGRPHLSCWPQGTWLTLPASQPRHPV